jgi:hypothetical protein
LCKPPLVWDAAYVARLMSRSKVRDRSDLARRLDRPYATVRRAFGPDWSGPAHIGLMAGIATTFNVPCPASWSTRAMNDPRLGWRVWLAVVLLAALACAALVLATVVTVMVLSPDGQPPAVRPIGASHGESGAARNLIVPQKVAIAIATSHAVWVVRWPL